MLSLSDNEFSVISFLVRNFSEKLTIRSIAKKLKFSPAGVFNILKKLEEHGIVKGERLGSGLFYAINFESRIAEHLAAIVLLYSDQKFEKTDVDQLKLAKSAVLDKENKIVLLITDNVTSLDVKIPGMEVLAKSEDELIALLRKKDEKMMGLIRSGVILHGEGNLIEVIKKCVSRF